MTHVETPLDPLAASTRTLDGKATGRSGCAISSSREFPGCFGKSRVRAYGIPGIRQTRWIVGRQQLTVDDVRAGTHFSDAIARTAWPIELHDHGAGLHLADLSRKPRSLYPARQPLADADNLVAAGRCIDADTAALSSVRVMGPCIAMGAAAAHALDLAGTGSVHQIDIAALRQRVRDNVD